MSASDPQSGWGLILAGGDGIRLRPLTRQIAGDERPKQFCPVLGSATLFEETRRRVALLVPADHIVAVVVRAHQRYYAPLLADVPSHCVAIQPANRGTASAILYGLLRLNAMAPSAPVAIFPSDHWVSDDAAFIAQVADAIQIVVAQPDTVILMGVHPDTEDADYGWIQPGPAIRGPWARKLYRVRAFWEKPSPTLAQALEATGCVWNSFVIVADPSALFALIQHAQPALFDAFSTIQSRLNTPREERSLRKLYRRLPMTDFSRQVLATQSGNLAVLTLQDVQWSDLGAPRRVMATLARIGMSAALAGSEMGKSRSYGL